MANDSAPEPNRIAPCSVGALEAKGDVLAVLCICVITVKGPRAVPSKTLPPPQTNAKSPKIPMFLSLKCPPGPEPKLTNAGAIACNISSEPRTCTVSRANAPLVTASDTNQTVRARQPIRDLPARPTTQSRRKATHIPWSTELVNERLTRLHKLFMVATDHRDQARGSTVGGVSIFNGPLSRFFHLFVGSNGKFLDEQRDRSGHTLPTILSSSRKLPSSTAFVSAWEITIYITVNQVFSRVCATLSSQVPSFAQVDMAAHRQRVRGGMRVPSRAGQSEFAGGTTASWTRGAGFMKLRIAQVIGAQVFMCFRALEASTGMTS
jgi:hypothetical protein